MINGSCLCGQVRYVIRGTLGPIVHCHCPSCRKAHGAAFSSVATAQAADFEILSGQAVLKSFESSPGKRRYFCSNCGSHLFAHRDGQTHHLVRLGTLDDDPGCEPVRHIWVSLKAPWYDIDNDAKLPRYARWEAPR